MNLKPVVFFAFCIFLFACRNNVDDGLLFEKFQNPDANARPMVRWWWNDDRLEAEEIRRELAVMKKAGLGGVEINPIQMRTENDNLGIKALSWAGPEWCEMVQIACEEAREQGMIADLLVGSGWPFGGEFLEENERIQRLGVRKQLIKGNTKIDINIPEFLEDIQGERGRVVLKSVKLVPADIDSPDEIIDLSGKVKDNKLVYQNDAKECMLVFIYIEKDFREVHFGTVGAGGPVMDHFNEKAVLSYMNRLKAIEKYTGIPLFELIRALFVDSIELSGANWNDKMSDKFKERNGYDLTPYLPFVLQTIKGQNEYSLSENMLETVRRVRYDFNNTVVSLFLENFVVNYQKFCGENDVLCRYQAYGHPEYMGIYQGNMMVDIPESNNWIYSGGWDEAEISEYTWNQTHGYMLWSKIASTGAHIMGKNITSCEAMTNTWGNFRTSLETIKQSDDMNFITGVNHSVLHGYNYSSPEAEFPGWYRFGAYFNERNTWWKYFHKWTDYNARLSSVFQNSTAVADIAVLGRNRDIWSESGRHREPLHLTPWYYVRFWEPISNIGSTCDYISQPALEDADIVGKELICGFMKYKALFLTDVESLTPKASITINKFARAGGKVVFVGEKPHRSLSYMEAEKNDLIVNESIGEIVELENVTLVPAPEESEDFTVWTEKLFQEINLDAQVKISKPRSCVYFTKYVRGNQDIYFFTNTDRKSEVEFEATFSTGNKIPYIWVPESGERYVMPYKTKNKLQIKLDALESALIVFEETRLDLPQYEHKEVPEVNSLLKATWDVDFVHMNGSVFTREMSELIDFKTSADPDITGFAGDVSYSAAFENDGSIRYITLKEVNQAVTELFINGQHVGVKWYGNHCYDISSYVKSGKNKIEIKLTTTLANYCMTLKDNPVAASLTGNYEEPFSSGLVGVELGR